MASSTEMANMATSHLAISKNINNLDTDAGPNAQACRRFFDIAMNTFQREFPFAFSTKRQVLALIQEDPNDEYRFEYGYPSDCQIAGKIVSSFITDTRQSIPVFKIMRGDSGRVIWTNCEDAELEYQIIESDEGRYQDDFILAYTYKLAELIAPRVTAGDPFGLGLRAKENYEAAKEAAFANSLNEQSEEEDPQSEFTRAREGDPNILGGLDWTAFPDNSEIF